MDAVVIHIASWDTVQEFLSDSSWHLLSDLVPHAVFLLAYPSSQLIIRIFPMHLRKSSPQTTSRISCWTLACLDSLHHRLLIFYIAFMGCPSPWWASPGTLVSMIHGSCCVDFIRCIAQVYCSGVTWSRSLTSVIWTSNVMKIKWYLWYDLILPMIWFDISLAPMPMIIYAKFMLLIDNNVFGVFGSCYWFDSLPIWFTETIFLAPQCADYSLIKLLKLLWCKCRLKLRLNSLVPYINQTIYCVICSWQFSRQHF